MTEELILYYNNLLILFGRINIAAIVVPIIVGFWRRKHLNPSLRVFLYYCSATLFLNLLEQGFILSTAYHTDFWLPILERWKITSTNFLQILYYLRDFAFLAWFCTILFPQKYGIWIKWVAIILSVASLVNYLFIEGYDVYGIFNPAADAIFSFALPGFYLWYVYRKILNFPVNKNPYFWLSVGLIFINLTGFFLYLAGDAMQKTDFVLFAKAVIVKNSLEIIGQLLLATGFWYAPYAKYITLLEEEEPDTSKDM